MFKVQRGKLQGTGTPQKPSKIKAFRDPKKSNTYQDLLISLNADFTAYFLRRKILV